MGRPKVSIPIDELQDAIRQLEATKLFTSPHKLYEAVAETPWARAIGVSAMMIYFRVKEANVNPANPVIAMRVKPARRVGSREPGVTFAGLDLLLDTFRRRGIEITSVEQLISSSRKSPEENHAIFLAWADLRDKLGIPKPVKKSGVQTPVVFGNKPEDGAGIPVGMLPDCMTTGFTSTEVGEIVAQVEITEQMPDGASSVSLQEVQEVESVIEPIVESVDTTVDFMPVAVPLSIQRTTIRSVPSRSVPVRSPMPPRPMPIAETTLNI